jgi:hypothetical protein
MIEGPAAWTRFEAAMQKVIAVPHSEVKRRIEEQRKRSAASTNRRGPKRKKSVSPGPVSQPPV